MPIFAGQLIQEQQPVCVTPHDSLAHSLMLMIEHNFSQLPVLDPEGIPLGIVTTASIAKALLHLGAKVAELRVDHAVVKLSTHPAEEDLLYLLDTILKDSAVFVVNANGTLLGIITEYDTTQYFRQRAEDLVLINEIEDSLKLHLQIAYNAQTKESPALREAIDNLSNSLDGIRKKSGASLKALCKAKDIKPVQEEIDTIVDKHFPLKEEPRLFEDLALSEFIQLAQKNWIKLEPSFGLAQPAWSKMMEDIRLIRNKLFHFKGDTTAVERHELKYCANWYANHPPITPKEEKVVTSAPDSVAAINSDQKETISKAVAGQSRKLLEFLRNATLPKYQPIAQELDSHANAEPGLKLLLAIEHLNGEIPGGLPQAAREGLNWWTRPSYYSVIWVQRGWKPISFDNHYIGFQKQVIPTDDNSINPNEPWEVAYWSAKLNCSRNRLLEVLRTVGSRPADIRKYLSESEASSATSSD